MLTSLAKRSFVLLLLSITISSAATIDRIVAVVNNEPVLFSEMRSFYKFIRLRKEIDPFLNLVEGLNAESPSEKLVLDYLIQEKLITQNPQLKVADAEVDAKAADIMRNNSLSRESLDSFLASKGYTFDDYWNILRLSLFKQNLLDREIRAKVNISDEDVRNHFFNLNKNVSIPLEYNIQIVVINSKKYKSNRLATETADKVLQSLKEGESFHEVAKKYSDDASSDQGGDLGFVSSEHLNTSLLNAIKRLSIGGTTPAIEAEDKIYVVRLLDVRSQHNERFDAEKESIREQLAKKEYVKQLALWTERTKNSSFVKINTPK